MKRFKRSTQPFKQTVFSNQAETKPILEKKWYGVIEFPDGSSRLYTYTTKQRSEAVVYFEEEARLNNDVLTVVSVFK
jgi:hypothetical protein